MPGERSRCGVPPHAAAHYFWLLVPSGVADGGRPGPRATGAGRCACHHRRVTTPARPEDMRASDSERAAMQERLSRAHDAGQLDLVEFDERVRLAWASRTRGELERLAADLPAPARAPARRVFSDTAGGVAMRVLTIVLASVVALNATVWMIASLSTDGPVFPWFLWVAGPPGAVLAVLYAAGIGRPRRER